MPSLRRTRKSLGFIVALSLVAPCLSGAARADTIPTPVVTAKAAEVVDGMSGQVLFAKNANEQLPIASITKLMTLYIAVRAIQNKEISLHDLVPVSEEAYRVNGSQVWLEPGERLSVDQLLKAVAIGSANDAAYALAEYIAGSAGAFVEDMNQTAQALGMKATHFANPHGLHEASHYSSAHDLALLAERGIRLPLLLHYTSMREDRTLRNGKGGTLWLINHNRLMSQFPGMDGLKTGYTNQAGFCMVATAKRMHTRMIAVVLGDPSSKARFQDASTLLGWAFQYYHTVAVAEKGKVAGRVDVRRGAARSVTAIYGQTRYLTLNRMDQGLEKNLALDASIEAPVRRGQVLGYLTARQGSQVVAHIPLIADVAVGRTSWAGSVWHYLWKISG